MNDKSEDDTRPPGQEEISRPEDLTNPPHANQDVERHAETFSIVEGISVHSDSNIVGGGTPGEGTDMGTASGPSDSGGG